MTLWDKFRRGARGGTGDEGHELAFAIRPEQLAKTPPCQASCPNSGDIRGWLGIIAQREKTGLSFEEACDRAWRRLTEFNPMPATIGRICPHPCETDCTRGDKDGPVAINAMERFLGDWGRERGLRFERQEGRVRGESIGVVGSGPAGLSFAYQMARRGYHVTIYDRLDSPGGMLRHGIPSYRLPVDVLESEVKRILELGIDLRLRAKVGTDPSLEQLRQLHRLLFLGIGAQIARSLGIPGEAGPGVWSGIEYLRRRKEDEPLQLGARTVVIGGGNTAIDAARTARRDGAEVVLLYRRTREQMPAVDEEIDDAHTEGVKFEFLAAPTAIVREGDTIRSIEFQRMELGEPDDSGRRRPVPIAGEGGRLAVDTVIVAVSQAPDLETLHGLPDSHGWLEASDEGRLAADLWAGGDDRGLGMASMAISQGRHAAEAAHAELQGRPIGRLTGPTTAREFVKTDFYAERTAALLPKRPAEAWLRDPDAEIAGTLTREQAEYEASRCLSCGLCMGCDQCWMYCNAGGFVRLNEVEPGAYYAYISDICEGCGKCIEVCPTGFLSARPEDR